MSWWQRVLNTFGMWNDDDCVDPLYVDHELADANDRVVVVAKALVKEQAAHRSTHTKLAGARREVAGLRRLILAYESIVPKAEAEKFARVIDDVNSAMRDLRDETA